MHPNSTVGSHVAAPVQRKTQPAAGPGPLRLLDRRAVPAVLRRGRSAIGSYLRDGAGRLLRRNGLTAGDRLAVCRQPLAPGLPELRPDGRNAGRLVADEDSPAATGGTLRRGVRTRAGLDRAAQTAFGDGGGRR